VTSCLLARLIKRRLLHHQGQQTGQQEIGAARKGRMDFVLQLGESLSAASRIQPLWLGWLREMAGG
jgi:hypothetical protein